MSDKDGNLNIVNTNDFNSYLSAINTQLTQKLDAMQVQLDTKVSYNDSISLALDHSQTAGKVPMYPNGPVVYDLAQIDEDPKTRQYLSYSTQNFGSGQTPDGCFPGTNGKCNDQEPRPNILSGKPINLNNDGKTISKGQNSNFKIVRQLNPGQKL